MTTLLCLFWAVWKERNRIAFENEEFLIHRMKNSNLCNFWFWTKLIVDEGPVPLISFFDWLSHGGMLCGVTTCAFGVVPTLKIIHV